MALPRGFTIQNIEMLQNTKVGVSATWLAATRVAATRVAATRVAFSLHGGFTSMTAAGEEDYQGRITSA